MGAAVSPPEIEFDDDGDKDLVCFGRGCVPREVLSYFGPLEQQSGGEKGGWQSHFSTAAAESRAETSGSCCYCGDKASEASPCSLTCTCSWSMAQDLWDARTEEEMLSAERFYLQALEEEPENAAVRAAYALFLWIAKSDHSHAEKYFDEAIAMDPSGVDLLAVTAYFRMKCDLEGPHP